MFVDIFGVVISLFNLVGLAYLIKSLFFDKDDDFCCCCCECKSCVKNNEEGADQQTS